MASIYSKKWPNDKTKADWMCRVKIGNRLVPQALRIPVVKGNKRVAQNRADQLEAEIKSGRLSDLTQEWLGPKATERLLRQVELANGRDGLGRPTSWQEAMDAYLSAKAERDTKRPVPGKLPSPDRVKQRRRYVVKWFINWVTSKNVPFGQSRSFTQTLVDYLNFRKGQPGRNSPTMEARTVITDYRYLIQLGDFLHSKGVCEKPDRQQIKHHVPEDPGKRINVPEWKVEVELLETLYQRRRESKGLWATWGLYVVVRGLGCRPSEAASLAWETVDLEKNQVTFLATKERATRENGNRVVPILYGWVRDALVELREDYDRRAKARPGIPNAVCLTSWDKQFRSESAASIRVKRSLKQLGKADVCLLKQAQKCAISQMLYTGFPATAVALWTGHTEKTLRKHYIDDYMYLPPETDRDYGRLGKLSDYGLRCFEYANRTLRNPLHQ